MKAKRYQSTGSYSPVSTSEGYYTTLHSAMFIKEK
jgi:hypothetical protein